MPSWRYSAMFTTVLAEISAGATLSMQVTHYACHAESEEEALVGLEEFTRLRKSEFANRLQWVALEKSETGATWNSTRGEWETVKRVFAWA